jgi:hypothetical protein
MPEGRVEIAEQSEWTLPEVFASMYRVSSCAVSGLDSVRQIMLQ